MKNRSNKKFSMPAGDVFGRKGYKAATIREICRAAGVNVASINYHFGGKKELYRTVVEDLLSRTFAQYPVDEDVDPQSSPESRLRAFVRGALRRLLSSDGLSGLPGQGASWWPRKWPTPPRFWTIWWMNSSVPPQPFCCPSSKNCWVPKQRSNRWYAARSA